MEKKHKSSWRMGHNGAQKKQFSRWKRVTKLMSEEKQHLGLGFLDVLDQSFKSLSGFEKILMNRKSDRKAGASDASASEEAASDEVASEV